MSIHKFGILLSAAALLFSTVISCKKTKHYELSRFISPETCGECHEKIYKQWKKSVHNLAHDDFIYLKVALNDLKGLTDKDEIKEAEMCVKCHTPVGFVSGMPKKTSDHGKDIPPLAREGVQCDFCHSATGAYKLYNASLDIDPGHGEDNPGIKRGPYKDSESDFHKTAYSAFHTKSEICAACHDVRHVVFGTKLETPYEEWKNGPYSSGDKQIPCQGCHMYQRPGVPATGATDRPKNPGTAAVDGPKRDHVFTHYFAGGNSLLPKSVGNIEHVKLVEERLKHAATIRIGDIKNDKITIVVKNTGAGHKIPTGLVHLRQAWIELKITDRNGKVLFHSGKRDNRGYVADDAVVYTTVFGDGKGNRVMNVAKAREILSDKRIGPLEEAAETYRVPRGPGKDFTVEVKLLYRIASQKLMDKVFGRGKYKVPVIVMASDKKLIKNK